ncbi:hypothetical protein FHG87_017109 [Trinorchestia longiramus]|nr:hypothetical protein FHG87_017109 [Trinorchestia longiramus]
MRKLAIIGPRFVNRDGSILLQDNARPNAVRRTLHKIQGLNLERLCHPPYSPDLAPTHYYLFQALDIFLQGKNFTCEEARTSICEFITSCFLEFLSAGSYPPAPAPAAPYGAPPAPYGAPAAPYGAPAAPYGAPASPYGAPAAPYGAPAPSPFGAPSPYGAPAYGGVASPMVRRDVVCPNESYLDYGYK